jgi:hypothetical protein
MRFTVILAFDYVATHAFKLRCIGALPWDLIEKWICIDAVLFHRLLVEGNIFVEEWIAHQVLVAKMFWVN